MGKLSGKVALVSGGSSGIGLASARLFQEEGAQLVITGCDPYGLAAAQQELGSEAMVVRSDAGRLADIEALMEQVKHRFGRLDILFLNAARGGHGPFEEVTEPAFDRIMDVNVKGLFFALQKALPLFTDRACVLVTTSTANQGKIPDVAAYAASKAAARSLVQSLAVYLAPRGVRINALAPGAIDTEMYESWSRQKQETFMEKVTNRAPAKRLGTPEDVAKLALFLASDDSAYLTGEEIVIDGGLSLLSALAV